MSLTVAVGAAESRDGGAERSSAGGGGAASSPTRLFFWGPARGATVQDPTAAAVKPLSPIPRWAQTDRENCQEQLKETLQAPLKSRLYKNMPFVQYFSKG